jgi:acyl carrier protein
VRRPGTSPDDPILKKTDLVTYARERLPEFMVPSNFILLDALPLLPNGKLNRRALLESVNTAKDQERVYVAPSTPTEELLAGIWSEVLKTDRIGIHDNFFDLGGHSFLAIKAHSRLSKTLGREIPLLKLFEYPTLQTLASFLDQTEEKTVPVAQTEDWAAKRRQAMRGQGQRQPRRAENGQASLN